jgi:integrase
VLYEGLRGWNGGDPCDIDGMAGKALCFLSVCGAPRAAEVFKMRCVQIDDDLWHVPANRMKGRTPRDIPLPQEATDILRSILPDNPAPDAYVFRGGAAGRSDHQRMRSLLKHFGLMCDVHGFRTSFRSWALDHLKHPLDIPAVELAHDHAIRNKVAEAYRDTGLVRHRRILNERWSSYLRGVAYTGDFAVPALTLVVDNAAAA